MLVYLVTNRINGKRYVGKTSRAIEARWQQHLYDAQAGAPLHLSRAIRKHGPESFAFKVLAHAATERELNALEKHYIAKFDTYRSGYNMTMGGEGQLGVKFSKETRQKISESHKGELNPFFGKTHSDANRRKMATAASRPFSKGHRRKISRALKGKPGTKPMLGKHHSEETKQKLRDARKRFAQQHPRKVKQQTKAAHAAIARLRAAGKKVGGAGKGKKNFMFGKHHSDATRAKLSARALARKGPNPMQGVPSPMKGKHHTPEALRKIREAKRRYWADRPIRQLIQRMAGRE